MIVCRIILVSISLLVTATPASAQFWDSLANPKIEVPIEHPASLPLKVTTVALGEPQGQCAESLLGRIEADFVQNGITVVDRQQLNKVLAEHKLQVSGLVDQKTAASVGQLLGAQALIFLKVLQCSVDNSTRSYESVNLVDKKKINGTKYITIGKISGSVRAVDLTSGRVLAAQSFEGGEGLESTGGYPDRAHVIEQAERMAAASVHKMFLPWTEVRSLVFYADTECNLKTAHQQLRVKDIDAALSQSEINLATCRDTAAKKPRVLAHAYYNLGIVQFIRGDYDAALSNLSESAKLQSGDIVINAIADCRRAKEFASSIARYETQPVVAKSDDKRSSAAPTQNNRAQPMNAPGAPSPIEERLQQLDGLKKKGLITQDEYSQKRSEILKGL